MGLRTVQSHAADPTLQVSNLSSLKTRTCKALWCVRVCVTYFAGSGGVADVFSVLVAGIFQVSCSKHLYNPDYTAATISSTSWCSCTRALEFPVSLIITSCCVGRWTQRLLQRVSAAARAAYEPPECRIGRTCCRDMHEHGSLQAQQYTLLNCLNGVLADHRKHQHWDPKVSRHL